MSTSLDTSPQSRLRHLAANLSLTDADAEIALRQSAGDVQRAEVLLARNPRPRASALTPEARIHKAAASLARLPDALNILHASIGKALAEPHNERFRKVNVSRGVFYERVASRGSAGVELLYAVGYEPMHGHLVLQRHDACLLQAALRALEATRETSAYREAKAALDGEAARRQAAAKDEAADRARRAAHLAKVPAEPTAGDGSASACVITIKVGANDTAWRRRFNSEDTLEDLMHFIRSLEGVPDEPAELVVTNVTTRPPTKLDAVAQRNASLYALDLWPVSHVRVVSAAAA